MLGLLECSGANLGEPMLCTGGRCDSRRRLSVHVEHTFGVGSGFDFSYFNTTLHS